MSVNNTVARTRSSIPPQALSNSGPVTVAGRAGGCPTGALSVSHDRWSRGLSSSTPATYADTRISLSAARERDHAPHRVPRVPTTRRSTERGHKVNMNLTKVASAALAALTVAAITIATEASAPAASPTAGFVAQQRLGDDDGTGVGPNTGPDPNLWNGGDPAGGTGISAGPDTGTGPGYFNGGNPAGGTGIDTGTDTGTGPGIWNGGESAGAS
jgi:hypothetical protein